MKAKIPLIALIMALAITAVADAKQPQVAYFKVKAVATQKVSWKEKLVSRTCDPGLTSTLKGQGSATLVLRTSHPQVVMARRGNGNVPAFLTFAHGMAGMSVDGSLERHGSVQSAVDGTATRAPCPSTKGGDRPPPDCGKRTIPDGSLLGVRYWTPEPWDTDSAAPLVPSVFVSGPSVAAWRQQNPYLNCPGIYGDDLIGGTLGRTGTVRSDLTGLALHKLFGHANHFVVRHHRKVTRDLAGKPSGVVISGSTPVTTTIDWKLTFVRLPHRPHGFAAWPTA
ncbi:MAG TPA: hypothetical protein VGJ60_17310 [Chloroflexota bacterium]